MTLNCYLHTMIFHIIILTHNIIELHFYITILHCMDLHFAFRISIGRLLYIYNWLMALQIMIGWHFNIITVELDLAIDFIIV